MRRLKVTETIGVGILALAVVAAPVVGPSPVGTADAADVTVLGSDFEDGTAGPWVGRGAAAVEVVDTDAHGGTHSLAVTGRTAGWHGT